MISILMATYNGEKYLSEQLDSLFAQTVQDFTLYISDDCSTDRTVRIIESYSQKHPGRIIFSRRSSNSGSAKFNFLNLMTAHKDDYVMLCDQDDVWLANKIELTLKRMKQAEQEHGISTPLLVHTELTATNFCLSRNIGQYHLLGDLDCTRTALNYALVQNIVAGCTIMYNRALAKLIIKPLEYCTMHDWWLFLIASAFGKTVYLSEPTILYRQHGNNSVGVSEIKTAKYIIQKLTALQQIKRSLQNSSNQARSFRKSYSFKITDYQLKLLEDYSSISQIRKTKRIYLLIKYRLLKNSLIQKIGQFIFI